MAAMSVVAGKTLGRAVHVITAVEAIERILSPYAPNCPNYE